MNNFMNSLEHEANYTTTENGALALKSTMNACLDAFGTLGDIHLNESTALNTFQKAYIEDKNTALRMLFYLRDVRGGQGVRSNTRAMMKWLAYEHPQDIINNFDNIMFYGRGDDYLCLLDTPISDDISSRLYNMLKADMDRMNNGESITSLAKWLPSNNAHSASSKIYSNMLMHDWKMSPKMYRKILAKLRGYSNVVETLVSSNDWGNVNYLAVPSRASIKYRSAFLKHDPDRYINYLKDVANGVAKVNAGALFPVDIVHKIMTSRVEAHDRILYDAMWNALPDYFEGTEDSAICMVDTSGSMDGTPLEVAVSLGIYCASKNRGPFANKYITFSERPNLRSINGEGICDYVHSMGCINPRNTNLESAFDIILNAAINGNCKQEDLPSKLYIITDMQFDIALGATGWGSLKVEPFMQKMKRKFANAGYTMPAIVYWNVRTSNCGMFQETFEGENCCMVSGYSPSLFKAVMNGTTFAEEVDSEGEIKVTQDINPMDVMMNTLYSERYDRVVTE